MRFFDVDAPDTSWRPGSEHPIPVVLGRHAITAFAVRWFRCSPLDGLNRTDATFLRAGRNPWPGMRESNAVLRPHHFWPGWKRGLLITRLPVLMLPPTLLAATNEMLFDAGPWWANWPGAVLPWMGHGAWFSARGVRWLRERQYRRDVITPVESAAANILRSRSIRAEIPRALVRSEKESTTPGKLWLPLEWTGSDNDRESLTDMLRERLGSPVAVSFEMAGATPHANITIPRQPPARVHWDQATESATGGRILLGFSASGPVWWDLGEDSPHIGVVGGSGSGKSELIAFIVAQFMRGGAGVVVLDPKGTSHAWLLQTPEVLYCGAGAALHDTILWMDAEMDRRAAANRESVTRGGADLDFPQLVVVLEERNSLQDKLRDHWADVRPSGGPTLSPAIRALDRLSSMGRTLGFTVLLAAQATAQQDIGKRNNFGAWAVAGRMAANHFKNVGTVKPAITSRPGRFAFVVAGHPVVFQAAFPDLGQHSARLKGWALGGEPPWDVKGAMQQGESAAFPRSTPVTAEITDPFVSLREFAMGRGMTVAKLRSDRDRKEGFPEPVTTVGGIHRYSEEALNAFYG